MAVPTIVSLTPTTGLVSGWMLIEITGTNFRTRTLDYAGTQLYSTVDVQVGGILCRYAQAVSSTLVRALVPQHRSADSFSLTFPAVAVVLRNLNDSGVPIAGELATKAAAFTYERRNLVALPPADPPLLQALMAFMDLLRQEVGTHVAVSTHPDYGDETVDVIAISAEPSIQIRTRDARDPDPSHFDNEKVERDLGGGRIEVYRPSRTYQVFCDLLVSAGHQRVAHHLKDAIIGMAQDNPYLYTPGDARWTGLPNEYPLEIAKEAEQATDPNNTGVVAHSMTLVIRGIPLMPHYPIERTRTSAEVYLAIARMDSGKPATAILAAP